MSNLTRQFYIHRLVRRLIITFSNQTPDSSSGVQTIKVLSIDAESSDMGCVKVPVSVIIKATEKGITFYID